MIKVLTKSNRKNPFKSRSPGPLEDKFIRNYKEIIDRKPKNYPMNISELTTLCGLPYDPEVLYVYKKIHSIFNKHRKYMIDGLDSFTLAPEEDGKTKYEKYKEMGKSEDEIFKEFIRYCVSWEVLPVYADENDEFRYHLLTLEHWILMIEERVGKIKKEFENKADSLKKAYPAFPNAVRQEIKQLGYKPSVLLEDGKKKKKEDE